MKTLFCVSFLLFIIFHICLCNKALTTKEVPLYIRQSWIKVSEPIRAACICETGVDPNLAFKSIMNTEIANNQCLMCHYKCLAIKLNLMEATTGEFVEKEVLRQSEGVTPEIFAKCNGQVKNEVDLCKKCFDFYLCIIHSVQVPKSNIPYSKIDEFPMINKMY
ncbi:hypothetical protein FQR65_LT03320 [Abscondita terminalis]|nr:hypothetical protein FQR65_LT03320 [Abscondita terminalis]